MWGHSAACRTVDLPASPLSLRSHRAPGVLTLRTGTEEAVVSPAMLRLSPSSSPRHVTRLSCHATPSRAIREKQTEENTYEKQQYSDRNIDITVKFCTQDLLSRHKMDASHEIRF